MNRKEKIDTIAKFVAAYPESTASRTILKRYYLFNNNLETSEELGIVLKSVLKDKKDDEIDFCYYLVK
ncbi:hypothetical protein [Halothermothrix orenii]|uniref:Uncharacterized protein n=1 Tax=Halothermothrix orenii (strain H 168 / OCM 544 / DSM 9562) TaxID=373903 RepID=B8CX34_HALOH|nr:hypothetical protein [Halothermothrix orenii]ACL69853.1 hypothetical protein Hore_10990 [Halothermothrix orenii H 168]